jgi:hypothetical protein
MYRFRTALIDRLFPSMYFQIVSYASLQLHTQFCSDKAASMTASSRRHSEIHGTPCDKQCQWAVDNTKIADTGIERDDAARAFLSKCKSFLWFGVIPLAVDFALKHS